MNVFTLDNILQLTVNGLAAGTSYALVGVGFSLILGVSGRFHIAFAVSYTLGAFVAAWLGLYWNVPFWWALGGGAIAAALSGILMELLVYFPLSLHSMRIGTNLFLMFFVASLGLLGVGQNLLALTVLSNPSLLISGFDNVGMNVGPVTITTLNVAMFVTSWVLIVALSLVLAKTTLGRMIRAVRVNWQMSLCVGINPRIIYLAVFGIGSFLAGVAGVFKATATSVTPDMGLSSASDAGPLLYAILVAFLAGLSSPPWRVALVGVLVGLSESYSSLFLPSLWTQLVATGILFFYVALRPVNFRALWQRFATRPARAGEA